jgi:hypothetical protein
MIIVAIILVSLVNGFHFQIGRAIQSFAYSADIGFLIPVAHYIMSSRESNLLVMSFSVVLIPTILYLARVSRVSKKMRKEQEEERVHRERVAQVSDFKF